MLPGIQTKIECSFCYWMVPACCLSNQSGTQCSWHCLVSLCFSQNFSLMKLRVHLKTWIRSETIVAYLIYMLKLLWQREWASISASLSGGAMLHSAQVVVAWVVCRCWQLLHWNLRKSQVGVGESPSQCLSRPSQHVPNSAVKHKLVLMKDSHAWLSWCRPEKSGVEPVQQKHWPLATVTNPFTHLAMKGLDSNWLLKKSALCHFRINAGWGDRSWPY